MISRADKWRLVFFAVVWGEFLRIWGVFYGFGGVFYGFEVIFLRIWGRIALF